MDRLDELALLIAIIDEGTMAAAARRTGRSPAGVTKILSQFEARLGVRLVERTTRRLAATDAGRKLADSARHLLADYDASLHEAMGDVAAPRGQLRISAPLIFGRRHVAPIVAQLLAHYEQLAIELILTNQVLDLVDTGIDVALRIGHLDDSGLQARRVGEVSRIVVGSPAYFALHGMPAEPADLQKHFLVVQSNHGDIADWRFQAPHGGSLPIRARSRFVVNQAETAIDAALAGTGLIRPLSYQVSDELANGSLLRVLQAFEPARLPVSLVYASKKHLPTRVRIFVDYAAKALVGRAALN
jgi:DNA-binding transcriptional LysR family regulator